MNTHTRGYDKRHQKTRRILIARMPEGQPCWWCGLPMHEQAKNNWDHKPLAADHPEPHGARNHTQATRLLHFTCNSQRQDGKHDNMRPAVTNRHPGEKLQAQKQTATVVFKWG